MSAVYKLITTRPTLNDVFWTESNKVLPNALLLPTFAKPLIDNSTVISIILEEAITWNDIASRIDELRPDIKDWLLSKSDEIILTQTTEVELDPTKTVIDNFLTNVELSSTIPAQNPFALTLTITHTFDSIETLAVQYNNLISRITDIVNLSAGINNIIIEEFYNDGVLINKSDLPTV